MTREQITRPLAVMRVRQHLERSSFPRLQMSLLVALTGASGFLASFALLKGGVQEMWLRYPLALIAAYLVFLTLLWLWLRTRADDYSDLPDPSNLGPSGNSDGIAEHLFSGKGGDGGGGGASSSFDSPASPDLASADASPSIGDAFDFVPVDAADELVIPIIVVLVGIGIAASSMYVIYAAPELFAELILDGILSATLYRRLRGFETRHWLHSAIRLTVWPFILTGILLIVAGLAMKQYAPEAHSIGAVIHHAKRSN